MRFTPHALAREDVRESEGYFLSLSQIRNLACELWAWRSQLRFRACWLTHS
jgi:hypothetical protein